CGVSLWPLFPQESPCISFANIVFGNSIIQFAFTIALVVWSGGPLTPRKYKPIFFVRCKCCPSLPCPGSALTRPTENICGNNTCLKTPQSGYKGWKAKIATSYRNAFMTNILLARG